MQEKKGKEKGRKQKGEEGKGKGKEGKRKEEEGKEKKTDSDTHCGKVDSSLRSRPLLSSESSRSLPRPVGGGLV